MEIGISLSGHQRDWEMDVIAQDPGCQDVSATDDLHKDLWEAVQQANIPTLLLVLVQLSGQRRWLEPPYRPVPSRGIDDNDTGGLPPETQSEIFRDAALDAIHTWLAGQPTGFPDPSPELLVEMLRGVMGDEIPPEYGPMLVEDLKAPSRLAVRASCHTDRRRVVVIGAGVSGMCAAIMLRGAGFPVTVLERNRSLGGTWFHNRYPGAAVDTPSHLYEYSFAPNDWPRYFATQSETLSYLEEVAESFKIRDCIEFGSEVLEVRWDEAGKQWRIRIRATDGSVGELTAEFVISAVGAFNAPKIPAIPGLESFAGPCVHTADWEDVDLSGKRVALVGSGASAMQVGPAIVDQVESLVVFQRSRHWVSPFPKFHEAVPEPVRLLMRQVPLYHKWYRARLGWMFNDKVFPTLERDPQWPHGARSMNARNDHHREFLTAYIRRELSNRPDLVDLVLPHFPPYGKRMLLDNGWYRMLTRPEVTLCTDPLTEVTPHALVIEGGRSFEADVLVLATGFNVVRWLSTLGVYGRSNVALRDVWNDDDAKAYLGLSVPEFPNFFILYGPNTQPGHGGSLIGAVEAQMHHVMRLLQRAGEVEAQTVEVTRDAFDKYSARVDQIHERMVWAHPAAQSYGRNGKGRVVVNSAFRVVDFWHLTRVPVWGDYVFR